MNPTTNMAEILKRDGVLVYKTRGVSMEPLFRQNRDLVIIRPCDGELKKYDVPLYYRPQKNSYVLHRIVAVREDEYLIRGDNTYTKEHVPKKDVVGVLTEFQRKGKKHSVNERGYKLYSRFWVFIFPLKLAYHKARHYGGVTKKAIKKALKGGKST